MVVVMVVIVVMVVCLFQVNEHLGKNETNCPNGFVKIFCKLISI
jgi:hypothetical protein